MSSPLFSTYRTGENRVTSSMMAVFERLDLSLVRDLLEAATGSGDELRAVTFQNPIVGDGYVPEACNSGRFNRWFETKIVRNGYIAEGHDRRQVRQHAKLLAGDPEGRLFVLTPDPAQPAWFEVLDGVEEEMRGRIIWLSFLDLTRAVRAMLADPVRLIGEQTRFLLTELNAFFEAEGLLTSDDTVVVAARAAWQDYLDYAAYVCQPDRAFRAGLTHFGFYYKSAIQPIVPRILDHAPSVLFTRENAAALRATGSSRLADLIEGLLDQGARTDGNAYGVFLLSPAEAPETERLSAAIANDTKTESGRTWAWTLGQRYTSIKRLKSGATVTSQL
ncbi:MAG: hypothetical protein ACT4PP_00660 [Sporichthyaceae bacterium]